MLQATQIQPDIWCLDTGYLAKNYTAAYLLVDGDSLALIDCGVNSSVEPLLNQITELGFAPQQIKALCLTHAHLDHAGGAGALLNHLPNATVYGHKDTIRHLIDPINLEKGVRAVYGKDYDRLYGTLLPLETSRCQIVQDNDLLSLENKTLQAIYSPGHAWHHHAFYCKQDSIVFAGDAFGLFAQLESPLPPLYLTTTSPSQFNPEAMLESFDRIARLEAKSICVSHYGEITDVDEALKILCDLVGQTTAMIEQFSSLDDESLSEKWIHLCMQQLPAELHKSRPDYLNQIQIQLKKDAALNIAGLRYWLKKQMH